MSNPDSTAQEKSLHNPLQQSLKTLTDWQDRICGTDTAKAFWKEKLQMRRQFYEALQAEMQGTLDIEKLLQGE